MGQKQSVPDEDGSRDIKCTSHQQTMTRTETRRHALSWGANHGGRLGLGDTISDKEVIVPKQVNADTISWAQIECGPFHTVALSTDGEVYTWGCGGAGELGHGDYTERNVPTKVESLSGETIVKIACGMMHTAALTSEGKLLTWYVRRFITFLFQSNHH